MALYYGTADALQARLKGPYGSVAIRAVEVCLSADGWKGAVSPYSQVVTVPGITPPAGWICSRMRLCWKKCAWRAWVWLRRMMGAR